MATVIFTDPQFKDFPKVDDEFSKPIIYVNRSTFRGFEAKFVLRQTNEDGLPFGLKVTTGEPTLDARILLEDNVVQTEFPGADPTDPDDVTIETAIRYEDGFLENYTRLAGTPASAPDPTFSVGATLLGSGFTVDANGHLIAGTANAFRALGITVWNFSMDAKRIFDAFVTRSYADEVAIIAKILAGNDTIFVDGGEASGLAGNDRIYGGTDSNEMFGGAGADKLFGGDERQIDVELYGNSGDDLYGEAGNDTLEGGKGYDFLDGGSGSDRLTGGADPDWLEGGAGKDTLIGGSGADTFVYGKATDGGDQIAQFETSDVFRFDGTAFSLANYAGTLEAHYFRTAASGHVAADKNDFFIYDQKTDQLWFDADGSGAKIGVLIADLANNFDLKPRHIVIDQRQFEVKNIFLQTGGPGNDTLEGQVGGLIVDDFEQPPVSFFSNDIDELQGKTGNDTLRGGNGDDILVGGSGRDTIDGGANADTLVYATANEGGDKIVNFDAADHFQFESLEFSLGNYFGTLKSANFVARTSGHAAGDANDFFIFDKKLDQLWFDDDGKGAHKAVMIADLSNDFNLTAADILIV